MSDVRVEIIEDERYPDFDMEKRESGRFTVPEELLERWKVASAEYAAVQKEIEDTWRAQCATILHSSVIVGCLHRWSTDGICVRCTADREDVEDA